MLAFICAIGVAFATVELTPEPEAPANDYVLIDGSWETIPEQDCSIGEKTCRVQFGEGGPIYEVYDEKDLNTLKSNTTDEPNILTP